MDTKDCEETTWQKND